MPASPSSTSVGAGGRSPRAMGGGRATGGGGGGGTVRQRRTGTSSAAASGRSRAAQNTTGMWHFYTDDSPGIKVGPVPVLVMSLAFIASVFMLHIWGKYTRSV
ncbi:transport sec61 subunit beta-like protein [Dermatophagoides farinae]|uniref:Protein transport protein Sec61 subunit beta n=2 Tax=Dermatophagoides farinae TaxID=6954 RepID=A0A9D4SMF3_DERFA|nr:protein transport protein Sec61 subunit beta-like isoform X1 [Dermatophagoides farinae]KAH7646510.1 transport sec61 subunit beta-like protein [Dermatophagoides farinae]